MGGENPWYKGRIASRRHVRRPGRRRLSAPLKRSFADNDGTKMAAWDRDAEELIAFRDGPARPRQS